MKATRKLIPAFAMLLIAAVMMSTATFAWFSTNATVTASGFAITAKADNAFIVISENPIMQNGVANPEELNSKDTAVTVTSNHTGTVAPVSLLLTGGSGTNSNGGGTLQKWQTGTSDKTDVHNSNVKYTEVKTDALAGYTIHKTLYIRSAQGFPSAQNLILKSVTVGSSLAFAPAVSVAICVNGVWFDYEDVGNTTGTKEDMPVEQAYILASEVKPGEDVVVEVYIYINGENPAVVTESATETNLDDMPVTLVFSTGDVGANNGAGEGEGN